MKIAMLVLVVAAAVAIAAQAATVTVRQDGSGDFTEIQRALAAAAPGDTVAIGPGEYEAFETLQPPSWTYPVDIYAYVTVDGLTIIGAGPGSTVIGPSEPQAQSEQLTPTGIWAQGVTRLVVRDLTVRHCSCGIFGPQSGLAVGNCGFDLVTLGVKVPGQAAIVEDVTFVGASDAARGVEAAPVEAGASVTVQNCRFSHGGVTLSGVASSTITECTFDGGDVGIRIVDSTSDISACQLRRIGDWSIAVSGASHCDLGATSIVGDHGISIDDSWLTGHTLSIRETTAAAVRIVRSHTVQINDSDLFPAFGWAVRCETSNAAPRFVNMTGNFWSVSDSTAIAGLVWDRNDDVSIPEVVGFVPFASAQTPTQERSWGEVKSLFRERTE